MNLKTLRETFVGVLDLGFCFYNEKEHSRTRPCESSTSADGERVEVVVDEVINDAG